MPAWPQPSGWGGGRTLQLADLLGALAGAPPLGLQRALQQQQLLLQLGLLAVRRAALLLQLPVQALQLGHGLGHLRVALPQPRRRVRLGPQQVVGLLQLPVEEGRGGGEREALLRADCVTFVT